MLTFSPHGLGLVCLKFPGSMIYEMGTRVTVRGWHSEAERVRVLSWEIPPRSLPYAMKDLEEENIHTHVRHSDF